MSIERAVATSWHSHPKIYNVGHAALTGLFDSPVLIEEKIDGSQFSFGIYGGVLKCRSKGQQLTVDAPEKMFEKAVATAMRLVPMLKEGWMYRGEFLISPSHNTIKYERVPDSNVIIFDICTDEETYLGYEEKAAECLRLGLECVPLLARSVITEGSELTDLLQTVSVLGGSTIEGVVIKNYGVFGKDGKALMAKHVRESFREANAANWKVTNPKSGDVIDSLVEALKTEARWAKSVQHLRESGQLAGDPRDIGNLIKEAQRDAKEECAEQIADVLVKWAMPQILRRVTHGLPEWYKDRLLASAFEEVKSQP